jgi:hypothetical protein
MNNTVNIYYNAGYFCKNYNNDGVFRHQTLAYFKPEPVLKIISDDRNKKSIFLKCPAFQDFYKNTFLIRSPTDLHISLKRNLHTGDLEVTEHLHDQRFFDEYFTIRFENLDFPVLSLEFPHVFYSDESINIEQTAADMHNNEFLNNITVINGKFDISKWIRPINFAFEIIDENKPLIIKKGDPLYYIKFLTEKKINFIQFYDYDDITKYISPVISDCLSLKLFSSGNTMEKNYKLASHRIESFKKKIFPKKSKCPFKFFSRNKDE